MLGRIISAALLISIAAQPAAAAAREPVILEPSSTWQIDYGETRCRIGRIFGEDGGKTALYLEQYAPSDEFEWVIGGPLIDRLNASHRFTIQFGPGQAPYEFRPKINLTMENFGKAVGGNGFEGWSNAEDGAKDENSAEPVGLPSLSSEQGKGIDWIEVSRAGRAYRLNTGNLAPVFDAMNACMENLVTHWGADIETMKSRKTEPEIVNLEQVVRLVQTRYPKAAEMHGSQASLQIRVMVEADGTVAKCHTDSVTKAERFDDSACVVFLESAKFKPATDLQNRPIPSYYAVRVSYQLY
ncbi:energy transducer TonB [Qipengyuania qiaonensis]|uniref:Energy transducer TonB n=1 Tax=Qipengyuania qiaonensis TaxID=2867240 RepID=A0ABS7J8C3_9SPHN|nr:energy transducer TonB [Qipengyuania qiaonensis]MBX7482314.1 energy transducer TonB [Qipengyuania qiaonensis]